jgi:hypothetical protein
MSTCLPEAERLQASLSQVVPTVTAADAVKQVRNSDVVYLNSSGQSLTYHATASYEVTAIELVTYVFPTTGRTDALEIHIAWEVSTGTNPRRLAYVDAVDSKILGGSILP